MFCEHCPVPEAYLISKKFGSKYEYHKGLYFKTEFIVFTEKFIVKKTIIGEERSNLIWNLILCPVYNLIPMSVRGEMQYDTEF
jgi:hypothetical protein